MDFENHLYRIIIGSFIEDLRSDYKLDDLTIINEFEKELGAKESVHAAIEDFELERLYQQIIEYCPSFNTPDYWGSLRAALNFYDRSIRPTEEEHWED
ncbi:hypothetical protein KGR20_23235 [Cytobacillus oceanisediminis]|uniref:Uncharacterized protein n=1 Tax=Niallia alba TaxID=2729105 RepID=A0A7Y0K561_9BACI|nr:MULTISPECIES: hypothetical protein [Bacillaceae]MBZ9537077.1 hypothetical protein [Cytobacillus oceanisediminis]NMO75712.1 hypothetical protein [Niallia alba]UTI43508.1 hypothetical protein NKG37_07480 [Niallia sp. RD1]